MLNTTIGCSMLHWVEGKEIKTRDGTSIRNDSLNSNIHFNKYKILILFSIILQKSVQFVSPNF